MNNKDKKMLKEGWTLWFTGLHGSGKSTIAEKLASILRRESIPVVILDGDEIRKTISSDLGYTIEERDKHMQRVAQICKLISDSGILNIASVASPTERSRKYAKKIIKNVLIIYTKCPVEICEQRDVKGHYKKAKNKEKIFNNFVGKYVKYEVPKSPDITLTTNKENVDESVNKLLTKLREKGLFPNGRYYSFN
ncbi:unnamed protein product [marine sediment metagenome]|uniref:adenylyl-sulfate kinase n=1 Tax=marine sediment metagenome TaxID=412755 RepID=X0RQS4_9ZZZZ